jgi:hypothetical protein
MPVTGLAPDDPVQPQRAATQAGDEREEHRKEESADNRDDVLTPCQVGFQSHLNEHPPHNQ